MTDVDENLLDLPELENQVYQACLAGVVLETKLENQLYLSATELYRPIKNWLILTFYSSNLLNCRVLNVCTLLFLLSWSSYHCNEK